MRIQRIELLALIVLLPGCIGPLISIFGPLFASPCQSYQDDRYQYMNLTNYVVPRNLSKSPGGIPIGPGVNGEHVDRAADAVATCLGMKFRPCGVHAVMIAPDWTTDPKTGTQVFPCNYPGDTKLCTGVNQWPATLIITPDEHALTWEIERMLLRDDPDKDGGKHCWQQNWLW